MMSKKVIGLLTVTVFLFAFAMTANAVFPDPTTEGVYPTVNGKQADNYFQVNACTDCKCPVKNVPCPKTVTSTGLQGSVSTSITPTCPFDYDNGVNGVLPGDYGYSAPAAADRNCKVILNICSCPDACNTNVGTKIGIQMEILTPGVYWAYDPNSYDEDNDYATVNFNLFSKYMTSAQICADKEQPKNFGRVRYYLSATQTFNDKGKYVRTPKDERSPLGDGSTYYGTTNTTGDCFTTVPAANQVKVIESDIATDYTVTTDDRGKCMFWIDIPAMRLDGTAKAGDAIQVRVTLLWNRTVDSLCPGCSAPILCECVRTVGVVCADEISSDSGCLFFPYVLQGLESTSGWVTGVAISARGTKLPADAYCLLTAQDSEGTVSTYKKTFTGNTLVWAFVMDREIKNFNKTLAPGAISLKVESNYRIDGYGFMNANMTFGAGEMPRACGTSCNP
jgi:hypothetical protein